MSNASQAIQCAMKGSAVFCKFLAANDTGQTGAHQAGIYISKPSISLLFDTPGVKGENKEKWVKVQWQDDFETDTRFIYYGQGTRNEYRITNFGKGFPFLRPDYTGALFILVKISDDYYKAKTTCKDRWRQILNEANRLRDGRKYLCTLQQGISPMQMDEMEAEGVTLVVPKAYISTYPKDRQHRIWTVHNFVKYVKDLQHD